jgi:hypothetical protein
MIRSVKQQWGYVIEKLIVFVQNIKLRYPPALSKGRDKI